MSAEVATPITFPTRSPRRLQRGTRYTAVPENAAGPSQQPPPPSLYNLDSAFQLQEYIAQLVKRDPFDIEAIVRLPSGQTSQQEQNDPSSSSNTQDGPDVDRNCWVYEHLRRLAQDLTYPLITLLQTECNRQSCPEMKAGEWLYLCVAHGNGGTMEQCCAIDYILHTLDAATALLNSSRNFPSRIAIPTTSARHFSSLARRLSRIFAHAYFHHRELFEQAESENALYERFLGLVRNFGLVQAEFLVIDWEGRPLRKPRAATDQTYERHPSPSDQYGNTTEESANTAAEGPQPRKILTRDHESSGHADPSLTVTSEDAALMASPSGNALGRRRTDTMYLADDLALAALDSVLSGDADVSALDDEAANKEAIKDDTELEMVESVDPFEDENEVTSNSAQDPEQTNIPDDLAVVGDDTNVPDVEDMVVPIESTRVPENSEKVGDDSWPDAEILEEEAAEAQAEGRIREDVVSEPLPTPADEGPVEESKPAVAEDEEKKTSDEDEGSTKLPYIDAVDMMVKTLEEERKTKLEAITGSPPAADTGP